MTLRDDLIAAKALIDTPEKWRKDDSASSDGCCAAIACSRASRFGRIGLAGAGVESAMWAALYEELGPKWQTDDYEPGECIGSFNDAPSTSHADIMALFDRAIAAAESAS